ncbi:MAG: DUF692 domain-containing protein [Pirellulales bacterium]|nr:DUF692 domain-containing protein [Pirellulales bacterium]
MLPATGYALRDENRPYADDPAWTAVEVDFLRACHPLRTEAFLTGLHFDYVSIHSLELSVCSPDLPDVRFLDALVEVARENGAVAITDHLGFTHGAVGGAGVGHVTAPPFTQAALDTTCRNIEHIQRHFGAYRFYVENLAHFFRWQGTIDEAEFMVRVLERTGCGLLLDVTNAYANERNFGAPAIEFIRAIVPAANRVQMHLAGGFFDDERGRYVDSHSEPIPAEVWTLYEQAVSESGDRLDAVFIERDWNYPTEAGWRNEVHKARHHLLAATVVTS